MMNDRLVALCVAMAVGGAGAAHAGHDGQRISQITDSRVTESSALALSSRYKGIAYTVNDSDHDPVVFSVQVATGEVVGTATLTGVEPDDTEALAIGGDGRLYVGDIGDNMRTRDEVALLALDQPGRGDVEVEPTTYRVRYDEGSHDAETLLSDPVTGQLAIVTKGLFGGSVYELPRELDEDGVSIARRVPDVDLPGALTDGQRMATWAVLRTYTQARLYTLPAWREIDTIALPLQQQGESLMIRPGHRDLVIGSEGRPSALIAVPLGDSLWRRLNRETGEDAADVDVAVAPAGLPVPWATLGLVGGAVLGGAALTAVVRRRGRRSE